MIGDEKKFRSILKRAIEIAKNGGHIVVLGTHPTRPETGYGYIEVRSGLQWRRIAGTAVHGKAGCRSGRQVSDGRKLLLEQRDVFVECPDPGWRAPRAFAQDGGDPGDRSPRILVREDLPHLSAGSIRDARTSASIMRCWNPVPPKASRARISCAFRRHLDGMIRVRGRRCTNIIPLRRQPQDGNLILGKGIFTLHASGNYVHSLDKFVAVVGVKDLVVVETEDALLITSREQAQDVGKVVKYLDEKKLHKLT